MAKPESKSPNVKYYDALLKTIPGIERKGAALPYTSLNGNMFSVLSKEGEVGIRLSESDRNEFLKKHKTTLLHTYGAVMREYVTVPTSLLKKTKALRKYMLLSFEYAKTLKPKPTTSKKKTAKKKVVKKKAVKKVIKKQK